MEVGEGFDEGVLLIYFLEKRYMALPGLGISYRLYRARYFVATAVRQEFREQSMPNFHIALRSVHTVADSTTRWDKDVSRRASLLRPTMAALFNLNVMPFHTVTHYTPVGTRYHSASTSRKTRVTLGQREHFYHECPRENASAFFGFRSILSYRG